MENQLRFIFITNDILQAQLAEHCGVEYIMVDLEINGKKERQGHLNTFISSHQLMDVKKIKSSLKNAQLLVRVNPIYQSSEHEINNVITSGADEIMLPMFTTAREVKQFINFVDGRAKTVLLLETAQALVRIDEILGIEGIDKVHIGLNDLHLSLHLNFMFEILASDISSFLAKKIVKHGIELGIGGIATLGNGRLPAEYILSEYARLGVQRTILSRTFTDKLKHFAAEDHEKIFKDELDKIRTIYTQCTKADEATRSFNRMALCQRVREIVQEEDV